MTQLLFLTLPIAAAGVTTGLSLVMNRTRSLAELRADVDEDFASRINGLLNAQPGDPRDAEVWELIKGYGLLRFWRQARIYVGIATQELARDDIEELSRIKSALPSLGLALVGTVCECVVRLFTPQMTRVQAMTAAEIFSCLLMDMQNLCG